MSLVFGVDCFPRGPREFDPSLIPPSSCPMLLKASHLLQSPRQPIPSSTSTLPYPTPPHLSEC